MHKYGASGTPTHPLNLRYNKIQTIEINALSGLKNLTYLFLQYNQIERIHNGTFNNQGILSELVLSVNKLTSVTVGMIKGLKHLQILKIDNNAITMIETNCFNGTNISVLWLQYNKLTALPWTLFGNTQPTQLQLWINSNPLVSMANSSLQDGWLTWCYGYFPFCYQGNLYGQNMLDKLSCLHIGRVTF